MLFYAATPTIPNRPSKAALAKPIIAAIPTTAGAFPSSMVEVCSITLPHSVCTDATIFACPAGMRYAASCQASSRMIGTASPEAVSPSTSTSGPPIMKSV